MTLNEKMGALEGLNSSEKEAVKEMMRLFDGELNSEMKNDTEMFIRFLRARDFKIEAAADMLRKHIHWRKTNNVDTIATTFVPKEVTVKYVPLSRIGFDKDGAPIRYFAFGNMDCKGLLKSARKTDFVKTLVSYYEDDIKVMKAQSSKLGKSIQQWTYIMDFDGYTFAKATHKPIIECLIHLFQTYESNYPERLKKAYVINTSIYFSMIFSIVKPLLSGATVKKIVIYGKDGWQNELLKTIDPEVLPGFLGGKRTDPDGNPMCYTVLLHGETIPEEMYMQKRENPVSAQPDAKKLIVSRKSKTLLPLKVDQSGSMIEWEFETQSRDIGFELCFRENNNGSSATKELIPKQRIDAHLLSETGMFKCNQPGTYVLVFDNTYSWIHRKEIYCKVSVVAPNGQIQSY